MTKDMTQDVVVFVDIAWRCCSLEYGVGACTAALGTSGTEQCYNTRTTCQDTVNYAPTTCRKRITYADAQPVIGTNAYRCIKADGITFVPGKLDMRRGVGQAEKITLLLQDFLHEDEDEDDPYWTLRNPRPVAAPYFRKLLARTKPYQGSAVTISTGYLSENGTLDESAMSSSSYLLESLKVDPGGTVKMTAKDPRKLLDRATIPSASRGQLAATLAVGGASATLKAHGSEYGTAPFYARIGDEIIKVTARTGESFDTITRAQFGTTADEHDADSKVQLCYVEEATRIDDVWTNLLEASGEAAGRIDSAGASTLIDSWRNSFDLTFCISEPTSARRLVEDACEQTACFTYWDPEEQKWKLEPMRVRGVTESSTTISQDQHMTAMPRPSVEYLDAERITRSTAFFGLRDWSRSMDEIGNYRRAAQSIQANAEGANEYNDEVDWITWAYMIPEALDAEMTAMCFRRVSLNRDPPVVLHFGLEAADADDLTLASQLDVTMDEVLDFHGNPVEREYFVIEKRRKRGSLIGYEYSARATGNDGRWAFYAPDAHPDYMASTETERRYAYYSDDDGLMPDESEGYRYV